MDRRAIVLLSGGLDSTTVLAMAIDQGYIPYTLSFDYGQRHCRELNAAEQVAANERVARHVVVNIDLRAFGGSALTDDIDVPKHTDVEQLSGDAIPITYVPARNTIFLSYAVAYAETSSATDIFLGVNALDYSGYPDCRPEYIEAFEAMANLATRAGVEGSQTTIHAPLITMTKAEIIRTGLNLGVDYGATWSCYDPDSQGFACAQCDSCLLRLRGFSQAGAVDPIVYRKS